MDIAPGTYRSEGPEDPFPFCSFARLKTAGASFMDLDQVINIQNVQGPAIGIRWWLLFAGLQDLGTT